jgi:hypothetical protein
VALPVPAEDLEPKPKVLSAVQMAWGVYYIADTLIYTSIMAVTVVELCVWVLLPFAVTGCSKVLAAFWCLVYEETGKENERYAAVAIGDE